MYIVCRLAQSVRLMMALAIFLSYGLQFYVPMNIVWPLLKDRLHTEKAQMYGEYAVRTILVIFTCKYHSIPKKFKKNSIMSIIYSYLLFS